MKTREAIFRGIPTEVYDVVVIGGGITGAGAVLDASWRGCKTLLVEKGDFASGTSSKSGKLVHGGMRYLQNARFKLVFEACAERYNLATRIAPHLVKPTMFLVPNYEGYKNSRVIMALGLCFYTVLALLRNLGPPRFFNRSEALKEEKLLSPVGLHGAVGFYDCRAHDSRLVIDILKKAHAVGADMLNYAEVLAIDLSGATKKIVVRDAISGRQETVRARVVINAGGAWADEIIKMAGEQERFNLQRARGAHILLGRRVLDLTSIVAWEAPQDGRNVYIVPWQDTLLVGTTDSFYQGPLDDLTATAVEVDYLLEAVNKLFPTAACSRKDVLFAYAGVRPLIGSDRGMSEDDMPRDFDIIVSPRGLVSVAGGKLTTYRLMAKQVVDGALRLLDVPFVKSASLRAISGGDYAPSRKEEIIAALAAQNCQDVGLTRRLFSRYGTNAVEVLRRLAADPALRRPVAANAVYLYAELDYIAATEFVESVSDVLLRRTALALLDCDNGLGVVEEVARFLGKKCGWSEDRVQKDITRYRYERERARQFLRQ